MSGFYLSLNFGTAYFIQKFGKKNLSKAAKNFRNLIQKKFPETRKYTPLDLGSKDGNTKTPRAINYEKGDIFNIEFKKDNLPSDTDLKNALMYMLEIYDYIFSVKGKTVFNKEELLNISSERNEIVDDNINFNIENFGAISQSNMNIDKINVVGGQNATGKSTVSKLLYCFLMYNSSNRKDYAYESVIKQIDTLINILRRSLMDLSMGDQERIFGKNEYYLKLSYFKDIYQKLEFYENLKERFYSFEFDSEFFQWQRLEDIYERFNEIDKLIDIIEYDKKELFNSIMKSLLESEFSNKMKGFVEFKGIYKNSKFKFSSNFKNGYNFDSNGEFFITDVFYIDSFSCLDLFQMNGLNNTNHVQLLIKSLQKDSNESLDVFDEIKNKTIIELQSMINKLINGKFKYDEGELKYSDDYGVSCSMSNTASGIKQIGIIQLLLANRKLKENSFLIIDEPEVNLHPEWQLKFAEILVILAKKLNIYIYINTHSPMFIEAMSLYSEKYGLLDDTNFYLTEKHNLGGFTFKKIDSRDMGAVYENLSRPYDDLDEIKAEILLRK